MNIEEAKRIPMSTVLTILGCKPRNGKQDMYLSPLREENNASFHVTDNLWFDHGDNAGGNTVDFVCRYLEYTKEHHTPSDALRWINNMLKGPRLNFVVPHDIAERDSAKRTVSLESVRPLTHKGLLQYLVQRGIALSVAKQHLMEICVYNKQTKKHFLALGLKNEENGYELRNPQFKGFVKKKSITFIRGTTPKPPGIHIFEGMMDYLTVLTIKKTTCLENDTIVLNSLICLNEATAYIANYGYSFAYTWLDNDKAGQKATDALAEFFKSEEDLCHKPMNGIYRPHADVNAWHMHNFNLSL